jgi:hypothetical protein
MKLRREGSDAPRGGGRGFISPGRRACARAASRPRAAPDCMRHGRRARTGQVPEFEELKACVKEIKDANPDMGISKVHKAVKEKNPTWQVVSSAGASAALACGGRRRRAARMTPPCLVAVFRRPSQEDSARNGGDGGWKIKEGRGMSLLCPTRRASCPRARSLCAAAKHPIEDKQHT